MVVVVSCCVFPTIPDPRITLYSVEIGNQQRDQYVEWKDDGTDFEQALEQVRGRNGGNIASVFLRSPAINPISTLIASALRITSAFGK